MAATSEPQSGCPAQRSRGWLNSIALKLRSEERHRGTMPGTTERAPRYELYTSIQVDGGGEVLILTVKNLSLTGVLVAADGHDLGPFVVGSSYRLAIFAPENERYQVEVLGRVVRMAAGQMALTWDDEGALFQVESLMKRLSPRPRRPSAR